MGDIESTKLSEKVIDTDSIPEEKIVRSTFKNLSVSCITIVVALLS